jgi:hypothetical protein
MQAAMTTSRTGCNQSERATGVQNGADRALLVAYVLELTSELRAVRGDAGHLGQRRRLFLP